MYHKTSNVTVSDVFFSSHDVVRVRYAPPHCTALCHSANKHSQCQPGSVPIDQQCDHVKNSCSLSPTILRIPYLQYFCTPPNTRPAFIGGLVIWLLFLFSTIGIGASDFFCPNLATISNILGLDENVAGVTFLAFGNGSPDVFSTFSAMKANSGSLAIGELLGAASFIVSVVVGSMCLVKPFKVEKGPFLRDVGFFMCAVSVLLAILWDGKIKGWEAGMLVTLYTFYVVIVVAGSWWERRMGKRRLKERLLRAEYAPDEPGEETPPSLLRQYRDAPIEPYRDERK
jgi:sodium/potassium/calcium exchanger 6